MSEKQPVQYLSYKYRANPTHAQATALGEMLGDFCDLYNAALQQRIEAWRRRRVSISFPMQSSEVRACRATGLGLERWSFGATDQVLRRLDRAFKAFLRREKVSQKPGFPRFRSRSRYHSADFRVGDGLTLRKSGRIGIVGIPGEIKVKWHRDLPAKPKSAILTRQGGKWFIVFAVEVEAAEAREGASVGIDMGLNALAALSTGDVVARPNWTKGAANGLRLRKRALARCKRGSKRRHKVRGRLSEYSRKIASRRRDMLHKLSADITARFSHIAVEDLNIKGLARGMLAKEVHDAAWAELVSMLDYKAAKAGGLVVRVDPRGTSQTCPDCGTMKPKALSERMHRCDCGCVMDRDVAAAKIVHLRAFGPETGLRAPSQRSAA